MGHGKRSKGKQIYLHPDEPMDVALLDLWDAAKGGRGPQELFRALLRAGLRTAYEAGDIPPEIVRKAKLHKFFQGLPVQGAIIHALPNPVHPGSYAIDQEMRTLPPPHDDAPVDRPVVRPRQRTAPAEDTSPPEAEPEAPIEPGSPASILGMMGRGARRPQHKEA